MAINTTEIRYWAGTALIAGLLFAVLPTVIAAGGADADSSRGSGYGYGNNSYGTRDRSGYHFHHGSTGQSLHWGEGPAPSVHSRDGAGRAGGDRAGGSYVCRPQAVWCQGKR